MYRGRWDSTRTLTPYLQEGFAALATTLVPEAEAAVIRAFAGLWDEVLFELAQERRPGPTALGVQFGHAAHMDGKVGLERLVSDGGTLTPHDELEVEDESVPVRSRSARQLTFSAPDAREKSLPFAARP